MVLICVKSREEFLRYKTYNGVNVLFPGKTCEACDQARPFFERLAMETHGVFIIADQEELKLTEVDIGFCMSNVPTFVKYRNNCIVTSPFSGFDSFSLRLMVKA